MKPKLLFCLSAGCLILSVGILLGVGMTAGAQSVRNTPPTSILNGHVKVSFLEDYMQEHGKRVKSYCMEGQNQWVLLDTVPSGTRFIITDIEIAYATYGGTAKLAVDSEGTSIKAFLRANSDGGNMMKNLFSGIAFEPSESIYLFSDPGVWVTISGYYVDL